MAVPFELHWGAQDAWLTPWLAFFMMSNPLPSWQTAYETLVAKQLPTNNLLPQD